jgi:hypothetical protein
VAAPSSATTPSSERITARSGATEPDEATLEQAIVAAMLDDRGAVAEVLAQRLKARQEARAGNVVALKRRGGADR